MKAARAILADHDGDVYKLKEAEPWLFADTPVKQPGGKKMKRWRRLTGLDDSNDNAWGD